MPTNLMRNTLRPLYQDTHDAHLGLLIQRGYSAYDNETEAGREAKTRYISRICNIPSSGLYQNAYLRWRNATTDPLRFRQTQLALETRLLIGLTASGMLETGCAISHSYGMPYIPGSSIKGVVRAHVANTSFAHTHPDIIAELFGVEATPSPDSEYPIGLSGLITFHDAWWVPGSAPEPRRDHPLVEEIVTSHHLEYYGQEGEVQASDLDNPIPNAQIAVQGDFLFVLQGPLQQPGWLDLANNMLISALSEQGIGAKVRTGYGFFDAMPKVSAALRCDWVEKKIAEIKQQHRSTCDDALRGKALAEAWTQIDDPVLKQEALEDIRSRWQEKGWWDNPPGKSTKKTREIYFD